MFINKITTRVQCSKNNQMHIHIQQNLHRCYSIEKKSRTPGAKGPELSGLDFNSRLYGGLFNLTDNKNTLRLAGNYAGYATVRDCKSFSRSTQKSTKKYI